MELLFFVYLACCVALSVVKFIGKLGFRWQHDVN